MAVLSASDRAVVAGQVNRDGGLAIQALLKADLKAAVDAIDQWTDDNSASFNSAIPQPARGVLTARQKAALFMYVVQRRFGIL